MKLCIGALMLSALGVLAIQAGPVTEITGGEISRAYSAVGPFLCCETDAVDLNGADFSISFPQFMTDNIPNYGMIIFTDHVSVNVFYRPCLGFSCNPISGSLDLDVTTYLSHTVGPYPGPNSTDGGFSASGSFTAPGINIPLTGGGTTHITLQAIYDPDPGYYYYGPQIIRYDFVPAPEPALAIPTGLGLLALVLTKRRAGNRSRPPKAEEPCH